MRLLLSACFDDGRSGGVDQRRDSEAISLEPTCKSSAWSMVDI